VGARALQCADEPAELLRYWLVSDGRDFPMPINRGVPTPPVGCVRSVTGSATNGLSCQVRVADVMPLAYPKRRDERRWALFGWQLDCRHHDDAVAEAPFVPWSSMAKARACVRV
jgi:hypothetical protein